ncbi:hypothetical protein Tco_0921747 [Tanacetum coccineum]
MSESSSQKTSSPEITPKEEPVTLDKLENLNPFLPASQVDFTFNEITFTTNNEVALLYPSHPNQDYFEAVSDFISKCCLKEAFTRAPNQYKEYLRGVRGDIGITTFRNALRAQYLPYLRVKQVDYAKIIWEDLIHKLNKKSREKIVPYPRFLSLLLKHMMPEYENEELTINPTQVFSVHNLTLKPNQPEEHPFTDHMKAICNLDVPVDSEAPKPSSQTEEETKSSSAKDKSPSHPSPPTPVVGEMHKEAQQATGGPKSLGATSKEGAHPQLSSDFTAEADLGSNLSVLVDKTKFARDGLAHTNSDLPSLLLNPLLDEPIIVSDESEEEEEVAKDKDTEATSRDKEELEQAKAKAKAEVASMKAKPSYPDINQLTEILVTSLKPELSKLLASHDFASCLPTELKELPSKITGLSGEIKEIKKHLRGIEIELPRDLKEIPTKLETFTSTISSLSSHVAEMKNIQWELPTEFATMVENASGATSMNVPSTGKSTASPAEGEKNTKDVETNL